MKSRADDWVEVLSKEEILGTLDKNGRLDELSPSIQAGACATAEHVQSRMNSIKTVSVCGLGKLGSCIAATLAARGFEVVGVDIDPEKVNKINDGLTPLDEPLLAETIRAGHSRLRATLDPRETVDTDVTFFIPPSPSLPDGSFSNEFLLKAMQPVAKAMKDAGKKKHLFVCSSTTTPGAIDAVLIPMLERELGGICGRDFSVCYNPEFIALGDVINGLLEPDLVLIGELDPAKRRGPRTTLQAIQPQLTADRPHVHHQRGADEDFAEQLHHHEDQFHQPVAADRGASPTSRYPHHPRRSRQRQPDWKKIPARRVKLWRPLFPA